MATEKQNYDRLMETMAEMEIVDSHEHLPPEADRVSQTKDFSMFFSHYCHGDLLAAGMPPKDANAFLGDKASVEEKWRLFEPFYPRIQDGSYCRAAHIAMEKFYGLSRLTSLADAEALTAKIRKANKPGLYRKVLKDACRIRVAMNYGSVTDDPEFFAPVLFVNHFAEVSKATIRGLEDELGVSCGSLSTYVEAVRERLRQWKTQGMKGVKFHFAYMRDLYFAPRTHAEAEAVFNRVLEEGYGWRNVSLGFEESRPLQDYMVHRLVEMAGELEVPVVFHSALQAMTDHNADDARPTRLWNLPHRYRRVDFVILHAGLPWMEDAALLAKHYSNVYLDMGWDHLMSPEISTRALCTWVDVVPVNKVFGFGGDYAVVEKVYGHLTLARQNIARALAAKMARDGMPLERARAWMRAMLFDNPNRVFRLGLTG
jgi:predicted TIM-barrel fold metal-dependent hydrolase